MKSSYWYIHFLKYLYVVGGNRGRGSDGSKNNNNIYYATVAAGIVKKKKRIRNHYTLTLDEREVIDIIPPWPEVIDVGGFRQGDAKIVLQDLLRSTRFIYI